MMKRLCAVLCVLAMGICLFSCGTPAEVETITAEPGLSAIDVAGTWAGSGAPFAYLILSEDGTYQALDENADERSGGFITEGEYAVLDGYGVDDPDLFLSLKFDAGKDTLTGKSGEAEFVLSRTEIREEEPTADPKEWYGSYSSDLGTLSIGQGAAEGTLLIAVTPKDGVTMSASLILDSDSQASCDMFTLERDGNVITLNGMEEEFIHLSGNYEK